MKEYSALRSFTLVWSALWRCQVVHVGMFIIVPALAAFLHIAMGIVLMPFLLIGEGDKTLTLGQQANPLREPGCWVTLMPCSLAERTVFDLPQMQHSVRQDTSTSVEPEAFIPIPSTFTLRHVWLVIWLIWFFIFLVSRERSKNNS